MVESAYMKRIILCFSYCIDYDFYAILNKNYLEVWRMYRDFSIDGPLLRLIDTGRPH
jgi:hypothetical protein